MKELTLAEIHEIEFDILNKFSLFCRENNLRFFLCGGTLLGAVRHKGFIPWDDDVDVCMPRPDYEKFIQLYCKKTIESNTKIKLFSNELNNLIVPFSKLKRMDTVVISSNTNCDIDTNLWIDIFPIDALPEGINDQIEIFNKAKLLRQMLTISCHKYGTGKTILRKILKIIIKPIISIIGNKRFCDKLDCLAKNIPYGSTSKVGCVTWGLYGIKGEVMNINDFEDEVYVEFCKSKMPIFSCWDAYLKGCYGDYLKIPSKNNRQTHEFKAFLL